MDVARSRCCNAVDEDAVYVLQGLVRYGIIIVIMEVEIDQIRGWL